LLLPLYNQAKGKRTKLCYALRLALQWWCEVLSMDLQQSWGWYDEQQPWAHLYADARGMPPRLAAVLFIDGCKYFCDAAPPPELLQKFRPRSDNQIMGLELLAIGLGLSSFKQQLAKRRIVIWSDNTGAEAAARSGRASQFDHTCVAHCLWTLLAKLRAEAVVMRVPTDDNIADLPSREEYGLLESIGAQRVHASLDKELCNPVAWESLSLVCNKVLPNGS
jgi:hypothetical protein